MSDMWDMKPVFLYLEDAKKVSYPLPHTDLTIKWQRKGRCGSLEFTYLGGDFFWENPKIKNGDVITLKYGRDQAMVFWGRVHKVNYKNGVYKITAFDQLRSLMNKDFKLFENKRASEIASQYISEYALEMGSITDTGVVIPFIDGDGKSALATITEALEDTTRLTKELFFIHDAGHKLELKNINDCHLDLSLTGYNNLYDIDHTLDIDSDTFNRIVLIEVDDKKKTAHVLADDNNINKWGALQYYSEIKDSNAAQIQTMLKTILELKNRELETIKLSCLGDIRCRAGYSITMKIEELGIEEWFLIEEATHKIVGNDHTMTLKVVNHHVLPATNR